MNRTDFSNPLFVDTTAAAPGAAHTRGEQRLADECFPEPSSAARQVDRTQQVLDAFQTVLTGLILAFIFRAFLVEAFIIPTGSMAPSLLGTHATRLCPACGADYAYQPIGRENFCPNCHYSEILPAERVLPKDGDRILVHKWPYLLGPWFGPNRWDVIVFRDPEDSGTTFIKRLVGLPGEQIEIVDGDVYIDGQIARKPWAAQETLWLDVFDQDHVPVLDGPPVDSLPRWRVAADDPTPQNAAGQWAGLQDRVIHYRGLNAPTPHFIEFAPADLRYFEDVYAYNRGPSAGGPPFVGDVRIVAEVNFETGGGDIIFELQRDYVTFRALASRRGQLTLYMRSYDREFELVQQAERTPFSLDRPYRFEFGHLDRRAYFKAGGVLLETPDDHYPGTRSSAGRYDLRRPVALRIGARQLQLLLRGLRVDRDVYYTSRTPGAERATRGDPFQLGPDEFFVLGDNSPSSKDSRVWATGGLHQPAGYRPGTVRRDQIVGRAALVYLPGVLPLDEHGRWRLPDLGRVRFIR